MGVRERWMGFPEFPAEVEQTVEDLSELFSRSGVRLAYLFGSLGKGEPSQDVDLALLPGLTPVFELRQAIEGRIRTQRLDLVDLAIASPLLRFEIVRTGRPIFAPDEKLLNDFELETIHLYRDTHPIRRRQTEYLRARMGG